MIERTPGPWFIDERGTHGIEVGTYFKANPTMFNSLAEDIEGMANARLIAAAPDLLAYAKCEEESYRPLCDIEAEGFPVMSQYGFQSVTVSAGRPLYEQVIDFLADMRHAAIAKAEGKA